MNLRLLTSKAWWYSHRHEILPTIAECFLIASVIGVLTSCWWAWDTYQLRSEAYFMQQSSGLFKGCVEGRNSLGIIEDHGTWRVMCETKLVRVR